MRILHLLPHLSGGGAERQFSYLAPELVIMNHEVHVAFSTSGPKCPELPGVVMHQLKSRSNYDPYLLWQLIRLIHRVKPDIIHTWILQMDILGGIAAKINKIPWILHEQSSAMGHPQNWKTSLWVRVGYFATAIVSNSRGGDEYWATQLPQSRRYIISNGLPVYSNDGSMMALPHGLSIPEAPIVLFVGRLVALKNLVAFLKALAYVKQKQTVFSIICGEGPQRAELELLRHKLGLDADVHFAGYLPAAAVLALIKKAAVFVSLSAYEGCPNTVQEAMVYCCPLVVSDIPAHREILDERCALFADPSNIQQTADTILQAILNADASKSRAFIARQKTQEWSVSKMAINFERVYNEVVECHSQIISKRRKPATGQKDNS
jgi:glycosyltransferase involved in cell wall biosynthesis